MKRLLITLALLTSLLHAYQADNRDKGFEHECNNELDFKNPDNVFYSGKMYGMLDMATYLTPRQERNPDIKGYNPGSIIRIICKNTLKDKHGNNQYGFFSNFQWHVTNTVGRSRF